MLNRRILAQHYLKWHSHKQSSVRVMAQHYSWLGQVEQPYS
jgi:hypothetical protein